MKKIKFKRDFYDYGCCISCKNCLAGKHRWLLWCKKKKQGVNCSNKCHLYKVKRGIVEQ